MLNSQSNPLPESRAASSSRGHVVIRLGTRASALARWQADWVATALRGLGHTVELVPIATTGDQQPDAPLRAISGAGVFTKEIQRALLAGTIDLAVHSLKDLPTDPVAGLSLGAVPGRESVADVLICRSTRGLADLPGGSAVATSSPRRRAQLLHHRPDLLMVDLRGNVETRIRKLDEGQFDAIVLAEAGLKRLGLADRITHTLPPEIMLPAPGQGALGLEVRSDDRATQQAVAPLSDPAAQAAVTAERALLAALGGGCMAPIAAWGRMVSTEIMALDAVVLSPDGKQRLAAADEGPAHEPEQLAQRVAKVLLEQGAAELIQ